MSYYLLPPLFEMTVEEHLCHNQRAMATITVPKITALQAIEAPFDKQGTHYF
jgi:hypothetical protein